MENPKRIAELFMLYTLGQLSNAEETELKTWRGESSLNEEIFQFETDPKNFAQMYREIEEKRESIIQNIKEALPLIWGKKINSFLPRIPIPRRLEAAMYYIIMSFCSYSVLTNWDGGRVLPGGYISNIASANWIVRFVQDFSRGFNEGRTDVNIEKDKFGNEVRYLTSDKKAAKDKNNILYTPRGGYYIVRLPDKSLVMLNAASSIWYPANFDRDTVRIILKGEAYFEVNRDSLHPFIVDVKIDSGNALNHKTPFDDSPHDLSLAVTRGRFNIKAYPDEPFIKATMIQGYALIGWDGNRSMHGNSLTAGHYVTEMHGSLLLTEYEDSTTAIAWKNGRFFYKDAGIMDIMNAVSRWYNVPLTIHDSIPTRPFHLDLPRTADIHEVFIALSHQGVFCDIEDRRIHIRNTQ